MITDKDRHEIAKKLRNLKPEYAYEDFFASNYLFQTMGFEYWSETAYDNGVEDSGLTKTGLYKLADLIDRPTCAIVESYMGDNLESVEETPHHVLSCGHIAYGEDGPMFCPVCGAAVTDDYR